MYLQPNMSCFYLAAGKLSLMHYYNTNHELRRLYGLTYPACLAVKEEYQRQKIITTT